MGRGGAKILQAITSSKAAGMSMNLGRKVVFIRDLLAS
jgi:hypothetical protein